MVNITAEHPPRLTERTTECKFSVIHMVWLASFVVIGLGVARELIIARIGLETPLKDLGQIALDTENSVPVWYSSTLMTFAALLLWIISRNDKVKFRRRVSLWNILAVVFVAMSLDKTSSFHEVLITPLQNATGATGIFHFSWVLVAISVLAIFALYILPDLFRLPTNWIFKFMGAGIVYVCGALGMELVGGYMVSSVGLESSYYIVAATIEETLEIIGLTLFVSYLFAYLIEFAPEPTLRFVR